MGGGAGIGRESGPLDAEREDDSASSRLSNGRGLCWSGDVLIDTGYIADFAVDWSLADGTMWLAAAPLLESIVNVYRSTDHGMSWQRVFWFTTSPLSIVKRVGLVFGEGESSFVNIFFWHPGDNGNIGLFRLKPDLSSWDAYWVAGGPDSITDFAVCRDYRNNYSLYCWAVVGNRGQTAPFLWSRDYGKTWAGHASPRAPGPGSTLPA
jgi:hypothetical protein